MINDSEDEEESSFLRIGDGDLHRQTIDLNAEEDLNGNNGY